MKSSVLRGLVVVASFLAAGLVEAQTFTWTPTVSEGFFEDPDNWNQAGAPVNAGDTIEFTGVGTTHTVDFRDSFFQDSASYTNLRALVGAGGTANTDVTFDLGGGSYELTASGAYTSAALRLGDDGIGALTVTNGAFRTGSFNIGRNAGQGTLTIAGSNTTWITGADGAGSRSIGGASTGRLHVVGGAQVIMADLDIGHGSTSLGEMLVTGAGSVVSNASGSVFMARLGAGQATATVADGATWYAREIRAGIATSKATIIVDNATLYSMDTGRTELYGTTIVRNGGVFHDLTEGTVRIGYNDNHHPHSYMLVESGGRMIATNGPNADIAVYGTTLQVRDTGSLVHSQRFLALYGVDAGGNHYEAVLQVQTGAVARAGEVAIGYETGRTGRVEVVGGNALLRSDVINVGGANFGERGAGFLEVSAGGRAAASNSYVRVYGTGTVTLDGGDLIAGRLDFRSDSVFNVVLHSGQTAAQAHTLATAFGGNNSGLLVIEEDAVFNVSLAPGFTATAGQEFVIIQLDNEARATRTGMFKDIGEGTRIVTPEGYEFLASYSGGANDKSFTLTVDVIPEPGVLGLLGVAGMALYALRRRFC